MTVHTDHAFAATILASVQAVWEVIGDFGNQAWNPGIVEVTSEGNRNEPGMRRRLRVEDGSVVVERLTRYVPLQEFSYEFENPAPLPILHGSVTVRVSAITAATTEVSWRGLFTAPDATAAELTRQTNVDVVWPALAAALAAILEVNVDTSSTPPKGALP